MTGSGERPVLFPAGDCAHCGQLAAKAEEP